MKDECLTNATPKEQEDTWCKREYKKKEKQHRLPCVFAPQDMSGFSIVKTRKTDECWVEERTR
jgi:hypothetical protein